MTTKTIKFIDKQGSLFLIYSPEQGDVRQLVDKLNSEESLRIKRVFTFNREDQATQNEVEHDPDIEIAFRFASLENGFYKIKAEVLGVEYDVFITVDFLLKPLHFIAYRDISIFRKIAKVVQQAIYIVSDDEYESLVNQGDDVEGYVPVSVFENLIKTFPNSTELTQYAHKRIGMMLEEYFPRASEADGKYEQYFARRKTKLKSSSAITTEMVWEGESEKYQYLLKTLKDELDKDTLSETEWQAKIQDFILLLFPKYIAVLDEITFKDGFLEETTAATRRADLILLDVDGHIDLIELKVPSKSLLRNTKYRQNYIPSSELSGSIMQLEKYLFSLVSDTKKQQKVIQNSKQFKKLSMEFEVRIVNPKGMLIVGRNSELDSADKKRDFEVIKRKYANVMDILTYDDLLNRLEKLITAMQYKEENTK